MRPAPQINIIIQKSLFYEHLRRIGNYKKFYNKSTIELIKLYFIQFFNLYGISANFHDFLYLSQLVFNSAHPFTYEIS